MSSDEAPEAAIEVKQVSKSFRIPIDGGASLKQRIIHFLKRRKGYREFTPLSNISFTINKGEFFGIVGRNGSGKSTLLKTIAGIYSPDQGRVVVNGNLVPFIELGVGFNPELTGRENVYLSAALLGFSRRETEAMYEEIVDFAELHDFMEERLKNYSSGMQVRLAFSIAIRARGDILLLDEVLAVGDAAFQQKCFSYFEQLKTEKRTVILVTHSMPSVQRFCDRALLLEAGNIVEVGKSEHIAELYNKLFNKKIEGNAKGRSGKTQSDTDVTLSTHVVQDGKKTDTIQSLEPFSLVVEVNTKQTLGAMNVGINIVDDREQVVFSTDSKKFIGEMKLAKNKSVKLRLDIDNYYTNGKYSVDVNVVDESLATDKLRLRHLSASKFSVVGIKDHFHSLFHPGANIEIIE
jgi:ABC-2 type transport system ATP-binding protein